MIAECLLCAGSVGTGEQAWTLESVGTAPVGWKVRPVVVMRRRDCARRRPQLRGPGWKAKPETAARELGSGAQAEAVLCPCEVPTASGPLGCGCRVR